MNVQVAPLGPSQNANLRRRLQTSGYCELRTIECRLEGGVAKLTGSVSSYYLKQIAQSIVARESGVRGIENRLEVR